MGRYLYEQPLTAPVVGWLKDNKTIEITFLKKS